MVSARSRISLPAQDILGKTCTDTLSDGPSNVFSECGGGDNVNNRIYNDFQTEIA
jgi:hypothetical protein